MILIPLNLLKLKYVSFSLVFKRKVFKNFGLFTILSGGSKNFHGTNLISENINSWKIAFIFVLILKNLLIVLSDLKS